MNQIPGKTRCNRKTYDRIFLSKMAMRLYEQRERMNILDSLFSLRRCDGYTIKTGSLILFNVSKIFFIKYVDIVQMSVELCIHELHTIKI